jgi:hypothetical protein
MNTRQRNPTGIAGELNGLIGGVLSSRAVDRAVHTAPPCRVKDFLNSFCWLKHGVGADSSGQFAAVCQGFHGPDAACLGGTQCGDRQKPDGSRANDRYRFTRADRRQTKGMHGNRERLSQSRFAKRHPGRYRKKVGHRQVDKFTEEARMVRIAQKANVRTQAPAASFLWTIRK